MNKCGSTPLLPGGSNGSTFILYKFNPVPGSRSGGKKSCIPTNERLSAEKQVTYQHFGGIFRVLRCEKRHSWQNSRRWQCDNGPEVRRQRAGKPA
jgi:hypothetical protein